MLKYVHLSKSHNMLIQQFFFFSFLFLNSAIPNLLVGYSLLVSCSVCVFWINVLLVFNSTSNKFLVIS